MQAGGFIFGYYLQQPMGLTAEIEELIQQQQKTDRLGGQPVENRREILENHALEAKAELRYQAVISEILEQDGKIKGVVWHEQGKRFCAECNVLLDCSADAEIAPSPDQTLRGPATAIQPPTLCFPQLPESPQQPPLRRQNRSVHPGTTRSALPAAIAAGITRTTIPIGCWHLGIDRRTEGSSAAGNTDFARVA